MIMSHEANAYLPCLKCNLMIPAYAKEIHATECHTLNLKTFTHPFISESSLLAQALIMGDKTIPSRKSSPKNKSICQSASKYKKNSGKVQKGEDKEKKEKSPSTRRGLDSKSTNFVEEPEWLKKILPGFHYRIVVMNELDMIRCDITAYTPVLLQHSGNTCACITVPDNIAQIGHIMLHRLGCLQHFPSLTPNALIRVKKIAEVKLAEQILVRAKSPLSEKESIFMECHLKNIMYSTYPLGAPFTLTAGSVVYPHTSDVYDSQSFTVVNCVCEEKYPCDGQLLESMRNLTVCDSDLEKPSVLDTSEQLDTSKHLLAQENHSCSGAYVTIDEYKEGDSIDDLKASDMSFMTSTPHKMSTECSAADGDLRKSFLRTKLSGNETSICIPDVKNVSKIREGIQNQNTWVRIGQNTRIVIERLPKDNQNALKLENKEIYCRDNVYHALVKILQNKLKNAKVTDNPFLSGWSGVLLYGPPGTGKTLLVNEIAASINIKLVTLTLSDVTKSSGGGSENVRQKFKLAVERAPAILFIDEIDSLCPAGEHRVTRGNDLTRAVISGIQLLKTSSEPILLVAASSRIEGVSMKLRCSGRFDKELLVPLPNAQQRIQILKNLMLNHHHKVSEDEILEVAKQAYGYSGADLHLLLKCAWFSHIQKNKKHAGKVAEKPCLCKEDLEVGMVGVVPTILRQDFQAVFVVKWKDIFGYEVLKSRLQKMIHMHVSDPENHPLKGLLLYGPPGCSKTMFVKALVNESSFSFFPLKCSDLLSKYVGETEKSLSRVFGRAHQTTPSIIFMDEIDSLCGDREGSSGLVSELLSLMSEIALKGNILVIGATNRPHVLDEALLKPGCLEQVIHVDLPNFECRCDMWRGILRDIPLKGEVNIEKLSGATAGHSGAEIAGIYQHAAQTIISKLASRRRKEYRDDDRIAMTEECLLSVISHLPARTPSLLLEKIKEFSNTRCILSSR